MRWLWCPALVVVTVASAALAEEPPETSPPPVAEAPPPAAPAATPTTPAPTAPPPAPTAPPPPAPAPPASSTPPPPAPAPPAPAQADQGIEPAAESPSAIERHPLALELGLGAGKRLGTTGSYQEETTLGPRFELGFWVRAFDQTELGVEIDDVGLGRASLERGANVIDAEYAVTTSWISGRFTPISTGDFDGFVSLRLGLALQRLQARGVRQDPATLAPPRVFSCSELDGPSLALGGGLGGVFGLGPRLRLISRLDASGQRLSGKVLGGCTVGVGSTTGVSLSLAVAYGFEN